MAILIHSHKPTPTNLLIKMGYTNFLIQIQQCSLILLQLIFKIHILFYLQSLNNLSNQMISQLAQIDRITSLFNPSFKVIKLLWSIGYVYAYSYLGDDLVVLD